MWSWRRGQWEIWGKVKMVGPFTGSWEEQEAGLEAGRGHAKGFFILLLWRCSWHLTLCWFQVYNLTIRYLYLLRNDEHSKSSEHQSPYSHKFLFFLLITFKTYSLVNFQMCMNYSHHAVLTPPGIIYFITGSCAFWSTAPISPTPVIFSFKQWLCIYFQAYVCGPNLPSSGHLEDNLVEGKGLEIS